MEANPLNCSSLNWESRSYDESDLNLAHQLFNGSCSYTSYKQNSKYLREALIMSLMLPDSLVQFGTNWYRMIPLGNNKDSVTPPPTSSVLSPDNVALLLLSSIFMELGKQVATSKSQSNPSTSTTTPGSFTASPPPMNLVAAFRPTYVKKPSSRLVSNSTSSNFYPNQAESQPNLAQYFSHQAEGDPGYSLHSHPSQVTQPETSSEHRRPSLNPNTSSSSGGPSGKFDTNSNRQYTNSSYNSKYPPSSNQLPLTPMTSNKSVAPQPNFPSMLAIRNSDVAQRTPPKSASNLDPSRENPRKPARKLSLNPQSSSGASHPGRAIATQRRPSQFYPTSEMFRPYPLDRPNHRDAAPSGLAVSIPPLSQPFHQSSSDYLDSNPTKKFALSAPNSGLPLSHSAFTSESGAPFGQDPSNSFTHDSTDVSRRPSRKPISTPTQLHFSDLPWYTIELRDFPLGISGTLVDEHEKSFWGPIVEPIVPTLRSYFIGTVLKIFRAQRKPGKPIDARLGLGAGDGIGIIDNAAELEDDLKPRADSVKGEGTEPQMVTDQMPAADNSTAPKSDSQGSQRTTGVIAHELMELMAEYCTQNFAALDRDAKTLLNQALWCLGAYQLSLGPGALKRFRSHYPGPTTQQLKRTHLKHCFYYARLFAHMWGGHVPISRLANFDISPISIIKVLSASACHQVRRALDELDARF